MPAASRLRLSGAPANTKGSSSRRESRLSKNGSGSLARSSGRAIWVVSSCSSLVLLTLAHRLECSGSSHIMV